MSEPRTTRRARKLREPAPMPPDPGEITGLLGKASARFKAGVELCGGDVDADWQRAASSGEEAVGGSAATPDQDVVDEIGHALGVEQAPDAPVTTSGEILAARDRHYWHLERRAAEEEGP